MSARPRAAQASRSARVRMRRRTGDREHGRAGRDRTNRPREIGAFARAVDLHLREPIAAALRTKHVHRVRALGGAVDGVERRRRGRLRTPPPRRSGPGGNATTAPSAGSAPARRARSAARTGPANATSATASPSASAMIAASTPPASGAPSPASWRSSRQPASRTAPERRLLRVPSSRSATVRGPSSRASWRAVRRSSACSGVSRASIGENHTITFREWDCNGADARIILEDPPLPGAESDVFRPRVPSAGSGRRRRRGRRHAVLRPRDPARARGDLRLHGRTVLHVPGGDRSRARRALLLDVELPGRGRPLHRHGEAGAGRQDVELDERRARRRATRSRRCARRDASCCAPPRSRSSPSRAAAASRRSSRS